MRAVLLPGLVACLLYALITNPAAATPHVEFFSPSGSAKGVHQVQARFSAAMVSFGDPQAPAPFTIDCPARGRSHWVDTRNWVHDFDSELPGGVVCHFTLRDAVRTADGKPLSGVRRFTFDTGGPAVIASEPWEGSRVDEEQIFLLGLDAPALPASIESAAHCRANGINETIGVEVVTGPERRAALDANPWFLRRYAASALKDRYELEMVARTPAMEAAVRARYLALIDDPASPIVAVRCRRRLPNDAKIWLDWGPGIASTSGVVGAAAQSYVFEVRPEFRAALRCERVNRNARCIPALGLDLSFSAPVARTALERVALRDDAGRSYPIRVEGEDGAATAQNVRFAGPLAPRTRYELTLPPNLVDDAGRPLANAERFPLAVTTDEDPPLAKFAANFGIVELGENALLPVTVRNLEPNIVRRSPPPDPAPPTVGGFAREITERIFDLGGAGTDEPLAVAALRGRILKIDAADIAAVGGWFEAVERAGRDEYAWDEERDEYRVTRRAGSTEILQKEREARRLEIPRRAPAPAFEVIGIPLREPGFYVVELASPRLGAALFGAEGTYFVQSLALVTNLGVHLKLGRESSLVWVTALDTGRPVAGATVTIADCSGRPHWTGTTDAAGIALIAAQLPEAAARPACPWSSRGLIAIAKFGADTGFVSSEWQNGIATWQFGLPTPSTAGPHLAATVFDRALFHAGETVHMKHLLRAHTAQGLEHWSPAAPRLRVRHTSSGDEFALNPDAATSPGVVTSTWHVPTSAKLGTYTVELADGERWLGTGSFRVESFRVPLLRAEMQARGLPLVRANSLALDLQVNYLDGGPAAELPISLRGVLTARAVSFSDFPGFTFMTGKIDERSVDASERAWTATQTDEPYVESLATRHATLDATGGARLTLEVPDSDQPRTLLADLEYPDPNGEIATATTRVPLWPSRVALGLKPERETLTQRDFDFSAAAVNLDGEPQAGVEIGVEVLQRTTYSHRKRLVGGFYAYEHRTEIKKLGEFCRGRTNAQGLLTCRGRAPVSGNLILAARAVDGDGRPSHTHREVWVAGEEDWWYPIGDHDRIDLIPEHRRYEPGDVARLQVRMPFRSAQALVTVEREGIIDAFVTPLSGTAPVIEIPLHDRYAPNVFVSVLAVRGRDGAVQPTALVDLGRPAYKLGMTELKVGWRTHELKVKVRPDRPVYRVRDDAGATIEVTRADGKPLSADAEIAVAVVDEGLLELRPNDSWQLLEAMMGQRGIEVQTATAQMQVVGRRHYGRKAVAPGGGGGTDGGASRTLFDTLISWQPRVKLDAAGRAHVSFPLNDSLTRFRVAAVATAGAGHFGTGTASLQTTQDLMLFSGLPPVVRAGDRYRAVFTVRNATDKTLTATVGASLASDADTSLPALAAQTVTLAPATAREVAWDLTAPDEAQELRWQITALSRDDARADRLSAAQRVLAVQPLRTAQASVTQLRDTQELPVARPAAALPGGGIAVTLAADLGGSLDGVTRHMREYSYRCFEQRVSRAIVLDDDAAWSALMDELPTYLDGDGLAKYFPTSARGSDVLSSYLLAIATAAARPIPERAQTRLRQGLVAFVEGRIERESPLAAPDLGLRKLAALAALSRAGEDLQPRWLDSLELQPALWPTSTLIDWIDLLERYAEYPARDARLTEALGILRARMALQGTRLAFVDEQRDALWWLMASSDANAGRALLAVMDRPDWAADIPRLVTGALGRQRAGRWDTTLANAWGALAMRAFTRRFTAQPVTGRTEVSLAPSAAWTVDWDGSGSHSKLFDWPTGPAALRIAHAGGGAPWLSVRSVAAVPLRAPAFNGFAIERTVSPLAQRSPGVWQRGDVYRVRLEIDAQSETTWVVVEDPLPAGATALGGDLGRAPEPGGPTTYADSPVPTFVERRSDVLRAYYEHVPQGRFRLEYSVRLNAAGAFQLPPTHVEAMYAPGVYGALPNAALSVAP